MAGFVNLVYGIDRYLLEGDRHGLGGCVCSTMRGWEGNVRKRRGYRLVGGMKGGSQEMDLTDHRKPLYIAERVLNEVEAALSYRFRQRSLLRTALVHSSLSQERRVVVDVAAKASSSRKVNNERLEFLGDAVLYIVLAEHLYMQKPLLTEGEMTNIRGKVSRNSQENGKFQLLRSMLRRRF